MFAIIGGVVVIACVIGGYVAMGGHIEVLIQPFELVIIGGGALGAFITSNPIWVVKKCFGSIGTVIKGSKHNKESYLELLGLQYTLFKLLKSKGPMVLEQHLEHPEDSALFQQYPKFHADHHAVHFLCDYLRLITLGTSVSHELEEILDQEIETHHQEQHQVAGAIQTVADALPALGIVAAVLGIIKTMGAINEPPEILGGLIAGALVGTFLGVLLAYGFVGPFAAALKSIYDSEAKYYQCIKTGLLSYLQGYAPAVAVEMARKTVLSEERPTFHEVEDACAVVPAPAL